MTRGAQNGELERKPEVSPMLHEPRKRLSPGVATGGTW